MSWIHRKKHTERSFSCTKLALLYKTVKGKWEATIDDASADRHQSIEFLGQSFKLANVKISSTYIVRVRYWHGTTQMHEWRGNSKVVSKSFTATPGADGNQYKWIFIKITTRYLSCPNCAVLTFIYDRVNLRELFAHKIRVFQATIARWPHSLHGSRPKELTL